MSQGGEEGVPAEDLLIVIIFDLHDLILDTKVPITPYHPVFSWIKRLLLFRVEDPGPHRAPVHGSKYLNVIYGIKSKATEHALLYKFKNYS